MVDYCSIAFRRLHAIYVSAVLYDGNLYIAHCIILQSAAIDSHVFLKISSFVYIRTHICNQGLCVILYICQPLMIKPLAVCSAGAGRTGTYMAIDTMMYQLEDRQNANIFEYVEKMRTRRTQMVQNAVSDVV